MSPIKVRSKSEHIQSSNHMQGYQGLFENLITNDQAGEAELVEFDFSEDHFSDLDHNKICPILIQDIFPPDYFVTDFRLFKNTLVVAGSNFEIVFINLVTKSVLYRLIVEGLPNCVAISQNGKYLAVSIMQDLNIYEIMGDLNFSISTIWLYKKLYTLHKGKPMVSSLIAQKKSLTFCSGATVGVKLC